MANNRQDVSTEVMLNLLNPFETFTPRFIRAEVDELSMKSMRLHTEELSREDCDNLMQTRLVSKVLFRAPFLPSELQIKVDVFWAKYVVTDAQTPPYADLGFNVRPMEADREAMLRDIVEAFSQGGG